MDPTLKSIEKGVSRRATRCSCGTKEAIELLGTEETSVELHTPQLDLGLCRSTTTIREVVGVSVSRMIDVRTGSISTKKIKVIIYHDNLAGGRGGGNA